MKIEFSKQAVKTIRGMDPVTKDRIKRGILGIPQGDIKMLSGHKGTYRLRVGNWRILFSWQENGIILVEKIGPRGQIYREV